MNAPPAGVGNRCVSFALLLLVLPLAVVAHPAARNRLWGFDAWTWLSPAAVVVSIAVALLLVAALAAGRPRGRWGFLLGGAAALLVVIAFRDTTHLLGDGRLWLAAVREKAVLHPHEPLAYLLSWWIGHGEVPEPRLAALSHALGLATLALLWLLAGRLVPRGGVASGERRWIFAVMATAGAGLFAFGYVEAYPALGFVLVALILAMAAWLEGDGSAPLIGGLFGLAVATHASAILAAPAVLFALMKRRPSAGALTMAALAAALPVALAWLLLPTWLPSSGFAETGRHWRDLFGGFHLYRWGPGAWCLDQLNRWGFAAGSGVALVVASLLDRPRWDDRSRLLALVALGLMLPALLLDTEGSRGAAADWDAGAVAGWPLAALGASLAARGRSPARLAWALPAVALAALLCAAQVNHRPETAEARFESLIRHTFRTPRARSWGWETVAARRREAGDMPGAARAYEAALAEQPNNIRLLRNMAGSLGRTGQSRRAADVLVRLVKEVPGDAGAWRHLGMELAAVGSADSATAALRRAVELEPASIESLNELARILLAAPDTRREARALLARSLTLSPTQPRADDLRRMVERLDRDGYGPRDTP